MSTPVSTIAPASLPARLWRRFAPPTLVLLYHRVVPEVGRDANQLAVSTENFAAQMAGLSTCARVLSCGEFVHGLESRRRCPTIDGRPRVMITFDDGYGDNFRWALPILRSCDMSATVFATSGLIGRDEPFWWDALEEIVFAGSLPESGWKLPDNAVVPADENRTSAYGAVHHALKSLPDDVRRGVLRDLGRQAGVTPRATDDARPMTWDEMRAWQAAGMSVGGHTRTHPVLAALEPDEIGVEIAGCKEDLERELGSPVETLAYPYGSRDAFDQRCESAARAAGYRCAFANRSGNARWSRSVYAVPRYLVRNWGGNEFAARFEGWSR